jgi:hypothetical protein
MNCNVDDGSGGIRMALYPLFQGCMLILLLFLPVIISRDVYLSSFEYPLIIRIDYMPRDDL